MAKTTKQLTAKEVLDNAMSLSFEDRYWVYENIKDQIQQEASIKKEEGMKADKILQSINNGK